MTTFNRLRAGALRRAFALRWNMPTKTTECVEKDQSRNKSKGKNGPEGRADDQKDKCQYEGECRAGEPSSTLIPFCLLDAHVGPLSTRQPAQTRQLPTAPAITNVWRSTPQMRSPHYLALTERLA
jgi:hypothetical protein